MTDHSDLIDRLRAACVGYPRASIAWPHRILHEAASALSSQSLSLSEAREEIERKDLEIEKLKGLVAGIREIPQEPWQDIATAPKNDGWKHLYSTTEGQDIGRWEASYGASGDWMDAQGYTIWGVTHWKPLPAAPGSALENGPARLADAPNDPASSDLSSLRKGAEVAVKPLEWRKKRKGSGTIYLAEGVDAAIVDNHGMGFQPGVRWNGRQFPTLDAAKSAAQSDFETRIRSALVQEGGR